MEALLKSRLIQFTFLKFKCEELYPYVSDELDLALFSEYTPMCMCHFPQRALAHETKLSVLEIATTLGEDDQTIENIVETIVTKHGVVGVFHLSCMKLINLSEFEICLPHLIELNIPTTKLIQKKYWSKLETHLTTLITKYPQLWNSYGMIVWEKVVTEIFSLLKTTDVSLDFIRLLAKSYKNPILPGLIDAYGSNFRVGLLTDTELSDALGLPIAPNDKIDYYGRVIAAMETPAPVIAFVREWNREELHRFSIAVDVACQCSSEIMNTENLLGDPIIDYPPGQIYRTFTPNGKIYQFTLSEMWDIAKKRVNPYTQEPIKLSEAIPMILLRDKTHITGPIGDILHNLKSPPPLP